MKVKSLTDIPSLCAYLQRIGAEPRSLRSAVVKEAHGNYWADVAVIKVQKDGAIDAPPAYEPTAEEKKDIESECRKADWPNLKLLKKPIELPDMVSKADARDVFTFRDLQGNIVMLQVRIEVKGERSYIPWTYWDDGEWRKIEPEGMLPLWGLDQLQDQTTVFIHEGAKAARACRDMVEAKTPEMKAKLAAHPWGLELSNAAHLGWIGGALSPYRTDWEVLKKSGVKRAYIVSDNDPPGISAVPAISKHLRFPTFHVQFTTEWPTSFDLADEFPKEMFRTLDDMRHYIGPSFSSCVHPATWATDQVPQGKGKPVIVLRDHFKEMWAYVEEADLFVCTERPEILRQEAVLNKMLSAFSHSNNTCTLLVRAYRGRTTRLCYRPDVKGTIVSNKTSTAINLHVPTHVKSSTGNPKPFLDFIDYMFPVEKERWNVLRWCATLIALPSRRMEYGMLLVSERQGVGKSSLGASILSPLVGIQNTGFPSESTIVGSAFNGWLANKRLVICNEIYSGHSWKAYNNLKSAITDRDVEVNEKFMRPYTTENWAHIYACSNSMRALRMEEDDRRWFHPEVTEDKWPRERFVQFYNWLASGGLSIIKHWAENFDDYVREGEAAPMTARKEALIQESRSEAQREVAELAKALMRQKEPIVFAMKDVSGWVHMSVRGRVFDSDHDLKKAMKDAGAIWWADRIYCADGRQQWVVLNRAALERLQDIAEVKIAKGAAALVDEASPKRKDLYGLLRELQRPPADIMKPAL